LPKLSVCFITYNHEKFIRQALESVLMQQCDFDFEVVIGNDCSTDGTTRIVEEFAAAYPGKIRLNIFEKNVGMTANWLSTISACKGEYIAMLEGDDYWTDVHKLQKQVVFLDGNPSYSLVAHDLGVVKEAGVTADDFLLHFTEDRSFTLEDCITMPIFLQTSSFVFRRSMLTPFGSWVDKRVKSIDCVVYYMLAAQGPVYYMAEKMSVYRMHVAGISHVNWRARQNSIEFDMAYILENFNRYSHGKFKGVIYDKLEYYYMRLIRNTDPGSALYKRALRKIVFLRPAKHMDLLKGYIINNFIPAKIYNLYKRVF